METKDMSAPNIIYVHCDGAGRYIQPCGYPVPTPALQALAENGVLFTRHYTTSPTCHPSRGALLTGATPHKNGMMGLGWNSGWRFKDRSWHLASFLGGHGYETVLDAIPDFDQREAPYDLDLNPICRAAPSNRERHEETTRQAIKYLREKRDGRPFFLNVGYSAPKGQEGFNFAADFPRTDSEYVRPPEPMIDTPAGRRQWALFMDSLRFVDQQLEQLVATLKATGQYENTVIICTPDHGFQYPKGKGSLYEGGVGTFLIMAGGGLPAGKVIRPMVNVLDLYPTICELIGAEPPTHLDGTSMMPLIRGEQERLHDLLFFEQTYHYNYLPERGVTDGRYKYIRRYYQTRAEAVTNTDDPADYFIDDAGILDLPLEREELFDLRLDRSEWNNLLNAPRHQETLTRLRNALDQWMIDTDDPIRKGPILLPEGGKTGVQVDPRREQPRNVPAEQWNKIIHEYHCAFPIHQETLS
jgi:N-sulfoglucosamine sulfohydrolase